MKGFTLRKCLVYWIHLMTIRESNRKLHQVFSVFGIDVRVVHWIFLSNLKEKHFYCYPKYYRCGIENDLIKCLTFENFRIASKD